MRSSQTLIAIAAFALAGLLSYLGAVWAVKGVERRTRQIVSHMLSVEGYDWAHVTTNGLRVQLTGTAPTEAARFKVLAAVDAEVDASRVHDAMTTAPTKDIAPPRFSVELLRNDDGISLIGLVPAATGRATIAAKVTDLHAPGKVSDLLETADSPVPPGWDLALAYGLEALARLPHSKISILAGEVRVTGNADSIAEQQNLETSLARAAPSGLKVAVEISAPRPVIAPFTLRFVIDEQGAHFDACSADTDRAREQIIRAGVAAGVKGKVRCTVGMGVPSPHWAAAAELGILAVKELGQGSITFSDADVTLLAPYTVEQTLFDRVAGELSAKLPDVFSLTASRAKPPKAPSAAGPTEFTASLAADGTVALRGRLTDERMRDAVDSYAKARFGASKVLTATRSDDKLPDGWPIRVLAGLQALSLLREGALLVQPELVAISGISGAQDAQDQISRILSDQLGPGQNFTIKVTYDKRLDAKAGQPTPADCVAAVQKAMAVHKINFESGSDTFTADAAPTLDAVAAELRKCPDAKLEIAGYTDSQGRAEMNLALSQSRAQAVLQALLNRRVLVGNIVARGYGEAHPIADNGTETGREANRRIEITLQSDAPDKGAAASDPAGDPAPAAGAAGDGAAGDGAAASSQAGDGAKAATDQTKRPEVPGLMPMPRPGDK